MNETTELMKRLAPVERKRPLLPDLTPQAEVALLCRVLFYEGYNDHIAGHISYRQADGTLLMNPWELAWDELCADDVLRIPSYALVEGRRALVVRDESLVSVPVETGLSNWEFAEIVSGLAEGDRVVVSLDRAEVKAGARAHVAGETKR